MKTFLLFFAVLFLLASFLAFSYGVYNLWIAETVGQLPRLNPDYAVAWFLCALFLGKVGGFIYRVTQNETL